MIPTWIGLLLLAAAAWRTWQLLAHDDLLVEARARLLVTDGGGRREAWEEWLECPYCSGFWIALAWCGAYWAAGDWALVAATPFTLSTAVIAIDRFLSGE
jgi:hypothetical protein